MNETFVHADDGTPLYLRARRGPANASMTAVLSDGIACDGFIWKYLWDSLSERVHVAHWNYRGHGRSGSPIDASLLGIERHSRDLRTIRGALSQALGVEPGPVVLLAHSMGCQVVLEHCRESAEGLAGLGLICGAPGRVTHSFKNTDVLAQVLPRLIETVDRHPHVARALWGSVPPALALKVGLALGEIDGKLMDPRDIVPYLEHMVDIELPMFLRMLKAAGEHTAEDLLGSIDLPTLVVAGERDTFTPPSLARSIAGAVRGAELLMTDGTHVVPLEHRALVDEAVGRLLDRAAARCASERPEPKSSEGPVTPA
jgi:pimeloyl-ACP methyl ester carboxylesterase